MTQAILMMPYLLPLTVDDRQRANCGRELFLCETKVHIAVSTADSWWAHSEVLVNAFSGLDPSSEYLIDLSPVSHEAMLHCFKSSLAAVWLSGDQAAATSSRL